MTGWGDRNDQKKRCHSDSLSTINPTRSSFRLYPGLCVEKSETKRPKQCAVLLGVIGIPPVHTDIRTYTYHTDMHTSVVHPTQDVATTNQVTIYIYIYIYNAT